MGEKIEQLFSELLRHRNAARLAALRCRGALLRDRPPNRQVPAIEIDVGPTKPERLATATPCREQQNQKRRETRLSAARQREQRLDLPAGPVIDLHGLRGCRTPDPAHDLPDASGRVSRDHLLTLQQAQNAPKNRQVEPHRGGLERRRWHALLRVGWARLGELHAHKLEQVLLANLPHVEVPEERLEMEPNHRLRADAVGGLHRRRIGRMPALQSLGCGERRWLLLLFLARRNAENERRVDPLSDLPGLTLIPLRRTDALLPSLPLFVDDDPPGLAHPAHLGGHGSSPLLCGGSSYSTVTDSVIAALPLELTEDFVRKPLRRRVFVFCPAPEPLAKRVHGDHNPGTQMEVRKLWEDAPEVTLGYAKRPGGFSQRKREPSIKIQRAALRQIGLVAGRVLCAIPAHSDAPSWQRKTGCEGSIVDGAKDLMFHLEKARNTGSWRAHIGCTRAAMR